VIPPRRNHLWKLLPRSQSLGIPKGWGVNSKSWARLAVDILMEGLLPVAIDFSVYGEQMKVCTNQFVQLQTPTRVPRGPSWSRPQTLGPKEASGGSGTEQTWEPCAHASPAPCAWLCSRTGTAWLPFTTSISVCEKLFSRAEVQGATWVPGRPGTGHCSQASVLWVPHEDTVQKVHL
jgi:hypothetical protein